jgi:SP family arabinose:H+ symporter-like MFS transporter
VGIALVDRIGRKTLLVIGVSLQVLALVTVGTLYQLQASPFLLLGAIILFLIGFAGSTGVATWVIISEIFPTKVRGQAMGVAVLMLWGADYIVSQTFPMLKEGIGAASTFYGYAVCCFLGLVFTILMVPETKGRTLEEIERSWSHPR